jgi:hypothetical protein
MEAQSLTRSDSSGFRHAMATTMFIIELQMTSVMVMNS